MGDLLEAPDRLTADPRVGESGVASSGCLGLDLAQLIEQAVVLLIADLRVVEYVVAMGVVLELGAQLLRALRVEPALRRAHGAVAYDRGQQLLQVKAPQRIKARTIRQIEVDRRHGDPSLRDGRQVGARIVMEPGVRAVYPVSPAVLLLVVELQLVTVDPPAEARHLDAAGLAGGHVHIEKRPRRQGHLLDRLDDARDECARRRRT